MPIDNTGLLRELIARGRIALRADPLLDALVAPVRGANLRDRVEGMLLGLAIGDALGNTTESVNPEDREARYGEIRDYRPNLHVEGRRVGLPSDDTQLAFWTLRRLNEDGGLIPERVAREFCSRRIFGIGRSVLEFTRRFKSGSRSWVEAASRSAGNGALMRIAPVLVPHLSAPSPALRADAAIAATITHDDPASTAGCVAFVSLLWDLLACDEAPEPAWWIDTFTNVLRALETEATYRPRKPGLEWSGTLSGFIDRYVRAALDEGLDARAACARWHSGAYLLETVPSALYILARYGCCAEEAIVRAVNDTRDNDTVGAIVGAAVGALHGRAALPDRWIAGLLGRTSIADDGEVFRLIDEAVRLWVPVADPRGSSGGEANGTNPTK
jgi:ADP-ribosylglycohydrolase